MSLLFESLKKWEIYENGPSHTVSENSNQISILDQFNPFPIIFTHSMPFELPRTIENMYAISIPIMRIFRMLNMENYEQHDVALPVTKNSFDHMEEIIFKNMKNKLPNDSPSDCSICQDTFNPNDIIKILPCKHFFHKACIAEWLTKYHHICPLCRRSTGEHTTNTHT
jgi:hypothetical protein